jgi:hypothetical protein
MNRSKYHSHLFEGLFKESRNPVKNTFEIMQEVMKSKTDIFSDNIFISDINPI